MMRLGWQLVAAGVAAIVDATQVPGEQAVALEILRWSGVPG